MECYTSQRWHGLSVEFSRLKLPDEYAFRWNGDAHYLAFHDLVLSDGEMEVLGEKPIAGGDLRNRMTYIPKGQTISGWAKPANRMNAFTAVYFCPLAMEEELQVTFTPFDYQPNIYFQDHVLGATMRKLGDLLSDSDKSACKVYAETLGLTAALELFRIERGEPFKLHAPGQLSQQQSKLMRDYIEQNLASDISLDDLATVCGLTRFHFSRAFKATFGEPPHRYLILRRISAAKQMLATTKLPVGQIAIACGFNGTSQLGRAFRNAVGQSAIEFRRRN